MEEEEVNKKLNFNILDAKRNKIETFEEYKIRLKIVNHMLKQHKKNGYKK